MLKEGTGFRAIGQALRRINQFGAYSTVRTHIVITLLFGTVFDMWRCYLSFFFASV